MSLLLDALKKTADDKQQLGDSAEQANVQELQDLDLDLVNADRPEPAQQVFHNKQPPRKHWLLLLLIVLLLAWLLWYLYELFSPPAPVAQLAQFKVLETQESVEVLATPPAVTLPAQPKPVSAIKPKPAPKKAHKQPIRIRRNAPKTSLEEHLQRGYAEYQQANYAPSRIAYQRALQQDKNNRDALLGLAANSMRLGQEDTARSYYHQLLQLDPRDSAAQSGLLALDEQYAQRSSIAVLKESLQQRPQSASLQYSLANKYAAESNWSQAQAAYFSAFSRAPTNADYAFNLAVSLDHLGKSQAALQYYQQAQQLSQNAPHSIDLSALGRRIQQLMQGAKRG